MKNFNKNMQRVFKGVIKPKAFFILLSLFFSSLAFAASLTVTWLDGRIPLHNSTCMNSGGEFQMANDSTEDPYDVAFSTDGSQVFSVNVFQESVRGRGNLSMNRLMEPFDVSRTKRRILGDVDCNNIDSFRVGNMAGDGFNVQLRNMVIADGGRKFFFVNTSGKIYRFDLSTPNEFSTGKFVQTVTPHAQVHGIALSDDGTKLFTIRYTEETPLVTTYQLPSPYDISSITQIHQVDLTDIGVTLPDTSNDSKNFGRDIEFSKSGLAMFVLIQNTKGNSTDTDDIYQFTLGKKFDVSTATLIGNYDVNNFQNQSDKFGHPIGFTFSTDGMRMFIVDIDAGGGAVDQINSYQLECPYGLVACVSDPTASIGSQIELSKQNINLNISTIFKRFEWIKRNRDQEDLTSHNINLNYPNPLLETLAMNLEPTVKKTIASLVSTNQEKEKKSKWSTWSLGDLTISSFDKFGFEMAKSVKSKGLTAGADRKFGDNKFLGLALRYGENESNIHQSKQNTEMESLTLNIYGIVPTNENRYINAVLGLSAMKFDNLYLGKISGERNGRQAFVSINYRTKNNYGALNITPTGKFAYGITKLSQYTDFLSKAIDGPTTDVRYKDTTFTSGELSAGFLFETDIIETADGTIQPMGGIEVLFDLTPDIDYKYSLQGSTHVNKDTILGTYSPRNIKASFGFEKINSNGFTFSPFYERIYRYEQKGLHEIISERFIIKISRSKEEYNSNFALYLDPLSDNPGNLSFAKNLNGFDLKLNSDLGFIDNSDYLVNFDISGKF